MNEVNVIGGGLAGVEAAWQAARLGAHVNLYEMRPLKQTPAHRTEHLAEIVCSNSLKSDEPGTASYLLKEELRSGDSLRRRSPTKRWPWKTLRPVAGNAGDATTPETPSSFAICVAVSPVSR